MNSMADNEKNFKNEWNIHSENLPALTTGKNNRYE